MNIRKKLKEFVIGQRWTIGFSEQPIEDILGGQPLKFSFIENPPKDRWFADPFILDYNNSIITVLVEEFLYKTRIGRIAKLTIDRSSYKIVKNELVLELTSHLSFPAIWRDENNVYLYPENANGMGLAIYEYEIGSNQCKYIKTISKEPLADAIITDLFGERMMFSTHKPTHNGNILDIHRIDLNTPQKYTQYVFDSNIARNAGDWFRLGEDIYRPAQDCNDGYGKAVLLQKVTRRDLSFNFDTIRSVKSNHPQYTTGCHTFNYYKGMTVIDVHGYRHNIAAKLYKNLQSLFL